MATDVFMVCANATECNYSNLAEICGTGKRGRRAKIAARAGRLCQYAVRETCGRLERY